MWPMARAAADDPRRIRKVSDEEILDAVKGGAYTYRVRLTLGEDRVSRRWLHTRLSELTEEGRLTRNKRLSFSNNTFWEIAVEA